MGESLRLSPRPLGPGQSLLRRLQGPRPVCLVRRARKRPDCSRVMTSVLEVLDLPGQRQRLLQVNGRRLRNRSRCKQGQCPDC